MRLLCQIQGNHTLCLDSAICIRSRETSGNIRIHAVTADILSHLIDNQHVAAVKQDARHVALGTQEKLRFLINDLLRRQGDNLPGFVIGIFQKRNAA